MTLFEQLGAVIDAAARVRGRARELFAPVYAEIGLNEMEMTVLNAVAAASAAPTVPRIGRSLGHPRQVIQRAATTLIGRGLIRPLANPDHKRAPLLAPTASGKTLKRKADRQAEQVIESILRELDAPTLHAAASALHDIRRAMESAGRAKHSTRRKAA